MCVSTCRKGIVTATTLLAGFAFVAVQAASAQPKEIPDFSSGGVGWQNIGLTRGNFLSVAGEPPPVANDPAYPYVPNATGAQPNYRIADLSNPNLKPWVKEAMKKDNDEVLAGKIAFTASSSCMPAGVPGFMAYGGATPLYFVQTPKEVWLIFTMDHQVRRIYMDVSFIPSFFEIKESARREFLSKRIGGAFFEA
jgi:hypothetical protein